MNSWSPFTKFLSIRRLKISIATFWIATAFVLVPEQISSNCGVDRSFRGYTFVSPNIIAATLDYAPFLLDFEKIYDYYGGPKAAQQNGNLEEWYERFCGRIKEKDLQYIIYKASLSELQQLRTAARSKSIPLDYRISKNTFARHLERYECNEVIDYLIFAKKCEPHVIQKRNWEDQDKNINAMQKLIREGLMLFRNLDDPEALKSEYVKLRYAYQIIRLAHYTKSYEQTLDLYEYLMPKIDHDPSIIEDWILGHKAGALVGLGRNVEASYIYAKIFQNCPSKRESAFRSFKIKTDQEWHDCLLLCETDRERATLYALRAHAEESRALEELEHIYTLDPESDYMELIMVNEIKKLEQDLLGYEFNDNKRHNKRYHKIPRANAGAYVLDMRAFAQKLLEENKVKRADFWKLAEGYLEVLAGDYYDASRTLAEARSLVTSDTLKEQLAVFEMTLRISAFDEITDSVEAALERIIKRDKIFDRYEDFTDFLDDKLAYIYKKEGRPGKAFLQHYQLKELMPNPKLEIIDDLLKVCNDPNLNRLERDLVAQGDSTIKNDLLDIKATMLLNQYEQDAALEVLKEMPRADWDHYGLYNPFIEQINDRVHRRYPDSVQLYNKGELIELMKDMEARAIAGNGNSAALYYQLGLAHYNMTYFSYCWKALDYFRGHTSMARWKPDPDSKEFVFSTPRSPYGNREHFDCSRALYFFEKARMKAGSTELGLRATFMAAKCEQNQFYVRGGNQTFEYFNLLVNEYGYMRDSSFYRKIIRECKYFQAYAPN